MKRQLCVFCLLSLLFGWALLPAPALADSGHARIVRLSLVQGDVSFTRQFHKDALDDSRAVWEPAPLNLPIRQGFALSTDSNARAEVEFENGAMAFLSGNTVIEFYDLSLDDGALVTRLVLRQGSAIFYVHPAKMDFFSVTGGDFSVEANVRSRFRLDNFDDGSTVSVELGQVAVLRKDATKTLEKGQSYSINVDDARNPILARANDADDFDKWVSGRIDSVVTATAYSNQYVNSPSYSSGFADLYNYGGWYNVPGYGFGWQPFGMGIGWSPFAFGTWGYDPFLGWNFIGSAPWGWLPYHYGGWLFSPGLGWVWVPTGLGFGSPVIYRPVTGVWVHSAGGATGIVPLHPADGNGRTPLNLNQGIYALRGNTIAGTATVPAGETWSVLHRPSRQLISAAASDPAPAPTKVSRTILSGNSGSRAVTLSRDSSITYDPAQHGFVNNGNRLQTPVETEKAAANEASGTVKPLEGSNAPSTIAGGPCNGEPCVMRSTSGRGSSSRPAVAPPSPPAHGGHSSGGGGTVWSGSHSAGASSTASAHSSAGGGHSSGGGHH